MNRPKVMFLCSGNTARSQMAEVLLRHHAGDRFEVFSAGLEPGELNPLTVRALQERGLDPGGLHPKGLGPFLGRVNFQYLITVCDRAERNCPVFPGVSVRLAWPFEDPAKATGSEAERLAVFRRVRDDIETRVVEWLRESAPDVRDGAAEVTP